MDEDSRISRRASLAKLGGLLAGAAAVGGWKLAEDSSAGPAGVASGAVTCVLAPEQTEGPYFVEGDKVRRNITEGKAGVPLTLRLTVVDVVHRDVLEVPRDRVEPEPPVGVPIGEPYAAARAQGPAY